MSRQINQAEIRAESVQGEGRPELAWAKVDPLKVEPNRLRVKVEIN